MDKIRDKRMHQNDEGSVQNMSYKSDQDSGKKIFGRLGKIHRCSAVATLHIYFWTQGSKA